MLSSQILQLDAASLEFARRQSALTLPAPSTDGGSGFAEYLAAVMRSGAQADAGTIVSPAESPPASSESPDSEYRLAAYDDAGTVSERPQAIAQATVDAARESAARDAASSRSENDTPTADIRTTATDRSSLDDAATATAETKPESDGEARATKKEAKRSRDDDAPKAKPAEANAAAVAATDTTHADARPVKSITPNARGTAKDVARLAGTKLDLRSAHELVAAHQAKDAKTEAIAVKRNIVGSNLVELIVTPKAVGSGHAGEAVTSAEQRLHQTADQRKAPAAQVHAVSYDAGMDEASAKARTTTDSRHADRVETAVQHRGADTKVIDLRDARGKHQSGSETGARHEKADQSVQNVASQKGSGHSSQTTFDARLAAPTNQTTTATPASLARTSAPATLRQALTDQLNGEIVRSARLVVRDSGRGEIRLHLKPESLGNVRIALSMHDGHIAGRILVDNQNVREVFEQNMAELQRAFQDAGFDATGLEVGLGDSGQQSAQGDAHPAGGRNAASRFGAAVPAVNWVDDTHELVDLMA